VTERINTTSHNIEVLSELGFNKIGNTTVFHTNNKYIISPSVAENTNGKYWFDLREVNLNRLNSEAVLLLRIVPDLFIVQRISSLDSLLKTDVMDCRPNSGNVWGLNVKMDLMTKKAFLFNVKNPDLTISVPLITKNDVVKTCKTMV
jgi:hypothetical protein